MQEPKRYYIFALNTIRDYPYCSCDAYNNSNIFYCILNECDVNKAVEIFIRHHGDDLSCWYCLQDALLELIPSYNPMKCEPLPGDVSFFYVRLPDNLCDEIEHIWRSEEDDDYDGDDDEG
jgi:hypothetical protein